MTIEEKVGQLLMFGYPGTTVDGTVMTLVRDWRVGGLVLLGSNAVGPRSLADFTAEVQAIAQEDGRPGLLLSIDQEGGLVLRLAEPFTQFLGADSLGATQDPTFVEGAAAAIGEEMRTVGLNMNLAPVLDVAGDPISPPIATRSFGGDPALVSELGTAFVRGLHESDTIATAKHFPGHGSVPEDSHTAVPYDYRDEATLRSVDLAPYVAAIEAGVDVIMTAHVIYPALVGDALEPATLSPAIVDGILRSELGFTGVVLTDSMTMAAITDLHDVGEASVLAVEAGVDMLLVVGDFGTQTVVRNALLSAVSTGRISEERLDQSVRRILDLKERYGAGDLVPYDPDLIGSAEHEQFARLPFGG
jgi:beta-N-acetylhexosaminidase